MNDVELRLPPDPQYVGLARLVVTVAARQAGMVDERIEDLKIAVSEATANAITSHQGASDGRPVILAFGPTTAGQFAISIAGAVATTGDRNVPEVGDWSPEGGLGVTLIRGLADDVDFDDPGTVVHMRFAVGLDTDIA